MSTSTFGVGNDFDERLLQELADAGGGHFYYIADAPQIRDAITSEVGETLEIVARDVALEITARDDIRIEPISPYRLTARGNRTTVSLGDLVSEQVVEVVLRLSFPYGDIGQRDRGDRRADRPRRRVRARGLADGRAGPADLDLRRRPRERRQPRDRDVDRAVARLFAARARQEAVGRNRGGDFRPRRGALDATAERIRAYAGDDPELLGLVDALESDAPAFAAPMAEPSRKQGALRERQRRSAAATSRVDRSSAPERRMPSGSAGLAFAA